MLKELESMTYEEAGEEFTVFSLSPLEKNPHKNKYSDGKEDLTSSQQETIIKKAVKLLFLVCRLETARNQLCSEENLSLHIQYF